MVLVNSAGSSDVYRQLAHSKWHGLTLADLIFPSFIWIVGITTTLSLGGRAVRNPKRVLARQAVLRAAKLYGLGICLYLAPRFSVTTQRLLGVLQRIAICYLAGSLLYLFTRRKTQLMCVVGLLGGYWALMTLVPAPGFKAGDLSLEGNLAHYVDRAVLGCHNYSSTKTWDPEGILSTLPAVATMLLGLMAGYQLQRPTRLVERLRNLVGAGALLLVTGLVVNYWFPVNKKLWTSSFVLVAAGTDCLVLPIVAYVTDVKGYHRAVKPLIVMGMNAITIYMLSELTDLALSLLGWKAKIYQICFQPLATPPMASLLYAAAFTLAMFGVAAVLYRKHIFLRI